MAMSSEKREVLQLPMCIEPRRQIVPGRGRRWRKAALMLVVLALAAFALRTGSIGAAPGAEPGLQALDGALGSMVGSLGHLPQDVRVETGGEVGTLARSIERLLRDARQVPATMIEPEMAHEIAFLTDLVRAIATELDALALGAGERHPAAIARLTSAAKASLPRLDAAVGELARKARRAIITIEERPGLVLVTSIDRRIHDGTRAAGIMLFLIGLLVVGFRILGGADGGYDGRGHARRALAASAGAAALVLLMAGSFALAIRPELAVALSAQTELLPREDPCQSLTVQREQLQMAQALGTPRLIVAVGERVEDALGDCPRAGAAVANDAGRPTLRDSAISEVARAEIAGGGAPVSEFGRPMQAGEAHAAEMPESQQRGPSAEGAAAAARTGEAPPLPANARAAPTTTVTDQAAAVSDAVPLPPGPAPRMPMPSHPAPREFVTTTDVNYRAGPSRSAPKLGTLADGTSVHMVDHAEDWSIVRLGDGRSVYVASVYLERAD
jgi:Bacterial SH3 domain